MNEKIRYNQSNSRVPIARKRRKPALCEAVSFRVAKDASGATLVGFSPFEDKPDLRNAHQERECPPRQPRWGRSSIVIKISIALAMATANASLVRAQYVYAQTDQSPQQQQKDENECSNWATQQTGYRPSGSSSSGGGGVLRGAARGAGIGAIGGAIGGDAGTGAAVGAAVGGISGGIRNHDEQSQRNEFDRAFASCMQDRGYTVN